MQPDDHRIPPHDAVAEKAVLGALLREGQFEDWVAMGIFLTFFRKRVFFLYLGICLSGTIGMAYAYQYLF